MRRFVTEMWIVLCLFPPLYGQQCANTEKVVTELYLQVLGRPNPPTQQEASGWIDKLNNGCYTVRDVVREMALSAEFKGQCELKSPDQRVQMMYRRLLDREVTDQGNIDFWKSKLQPCGDLQLVVHEFVDGGEYKGTFDDNIVPERRDSAQNRIALCGISRPASCAPASPPPPPPGSVPPHRPQPPSNSGPHCSIPPSDFVCTLGANTNTPVIFYHDDGCNIGGCAAGFHPVCAPHKCDLGNQIYSKSSCICQRN